MMLYSYSPIVIGYSGWEQDVFMTCLKRGQTSHKAKPTDNGWSHVLTSQAFLILTGFEPAPTTNRGVHPGGGVSQQ